MSDFGGNRYQFLTSDIICIVYVFIFKSRKRIRIW